MVVDNAAENEVPDNVDRCHLDRLLLARQAQVEGDQDDTDQELETVMSKPRLSNMTLLYPQVGTCSPTV